MAWVLGVIVFVRTNSLGVFSIGYKDLTAGLNNQVAWDLAGLLLITKLFATISCYGFGGCGGIFSPTLFFGGMCGIFVGGLSAGALHLSPSDQITLAVVGMSACLGSVVRAPVTGILIVFEMTHQFSLVPGLMLGALISQAVARRLADESLYDELILQDGHHLQKVIPPRDLQGWRQLPVSAIANFSPVIITDLGPAALKAAPSPSVPAFPGRQSGSAFGHPHPQGSGSGPRRKPSAQTRARRHLPAHSDHRRPPTRFD